MTRHASLARGLADSTNSETNSETNSAPNIGPDGAPTPEPGRPWRWYWNRLRVMEPLEWPHRAAGVLRRLEAAVLPGGAAIRVPRPQAQTEAPYRWLAGELQRGRTPTAADVQALIDEADGLVDGRWRRLDGGLADVGMPPQWLRSPPPVSGSGAEADPVREAIERHRHGPVVRLAEAWHLERQPRHLEALCSHLESWLDACPYPQGLAWASALDAGLRLLNWSMAWQLLGVGEPGGAALPEALRRRWIDSVYQHAAFVRRNRSRHSSANNHLLGELVGLVAAGRTWPLWPALVRWADTAAQALPGELLTQTHADGGSREQASRYQVFVFELMTAFVCMQRAGGHTDDGPLMLRLAAMARFSAALRDAGGRISHHGDADHATVLPLAAAEPARDVCGTQRLLALATRLGVAPELQALGANKARSTLPRSLADSGYYLLGSQFGSAEEVLMTLDAGTLGYLGIAAHGHADALSLRLSVGGDAVLVDRGTYTYNGDAAWRRYFRGTSAHNTVCVDGADQSGYGGPFLWLRKARCHLTAFDSHDDAGHVDAWHDGFRALADPVTHRRSVGWSGRDRRFEVDDTIAGSGPHVVVVAWHFAPDCQVALNDDTAVVHTAGGHKVHLRVQQAPAGGRWWLHHGADGGNTGNSHHGWHSPRFGVRVPAPSLLWRASVRAPCLIRTHIDIQNQRGDT